MKGGRKAGKGESRGGPFLFSCFHFFHLLPARLFSAAAGWGGIFLLVSLFLAPPLGAQTPGALVGEPIQGSFYVSVDDAVRILVNGVDAYRAGTNESRSPELELKVGDRVVIHLYNREGERRFMMLFASTDGRSLISFRHRDCKIVPDLGVLDFTPEQWKGWTKYAKDARLGKSRLPIKSYSDWIWGELDKCILAAPVTPQMLTTRPQ